MPSRERVAAFIASVVGGDHVRAIADYYQEQASMQENLQPPRRGRDALMAHEAKVPERGRSHYGGEVCLRRSHNMDGRRVTLMGGTARAFRTVVV